MKQTVACCKNVLKDYWESLRIDLTDKSEVWIEEAKRKRLVQFICFVIMFNKRNMFRSLTQLFNTENPPAQYPLTPTFIDKRTEEQSKKVEQDIKRAFELAPHKKPLEKGYKEGLIIYINLCFIFRSTLLVYDELMRKFTVR